jgi:hypothetical protein
MGGSGLRSKFKFTNTIPLQILSLQIQSPFKFYVYKYSLPANFKFTNTVPLQILSFQMQSSWKF